MTSDDTTENPAPRKTRPRFSAAVLCLWCWCLATAEAQPGSPYVACLDTMVINARHVFVGRIVEVFPPRPNTNTNVVVAVERRLKGDVSDKTQAVITAPAAALEDWKSRASRLLIANGVADGVESALDLSEPNLTVLKADMTVLRNPDEVLQAAEDAILRHPGVFGISTFRRTLPAEIAGQLSPVRGEVVCKSESWSIGCLVSTFPVDADLERWALEAVRSKVVWERAEGADALRHFPSEANIARLKTLLDDPGLHPNDGGPIYLVRQFAYYSLSRMGVRVPEPARRP